MSSVYVVTCTKSHSSLDVCLVYSQFLFGLVSFLYRDILVLCFTYVAHSFLLFLVLFYVELLHYEHLKYTSFVFDSC